MPPPIKSTRPSYFGSGKDSGEKEATPSTTLWVGNLSSDVNDGDLLNLFGKFGVLDATSYGTRSYGFVFFMRVEEAVAAKDTLQGANLKGISVKIEFARPAKACKDIWVGGISHSLSGEAVEREFMKFGKIEEFKFNRVRNTAFIEYVRLEDAIQAMRTLNGKQLGGEQVRVDFVRLQPLKRESWNDAPDSRDRGRGMQPSDIHSGSKRLHPSQASGIRDGQPSNILWVGYPPSVQIDEQMLHNAMILFGEIERISPYPARHFAFVEFRSMDEARCAKEGLQGRLFNDPRITIMYSNSGPPSSRGGGVGEHPGFHPAGVTEHPFRPPPPQMDMFGHNLRPTGGPNGPLRRFGPPRHTFDPVSGSEYEDDLSGPNWRRPSPLHSAGPGNRMPGGGGWDVYDGNPNLRDPKRARIDASLEDRLGLERGFDGGPFSSSAAMHGKGRLTSPVGTRYGGPAPSSDPDDDFIWRGVIAKGGTPVCHARCVPIGEGLATDLPEVVNCSARTGLDLLAKHYIDAEGFDIVYFLPDSEDDFASYTEFLRYLGSKDRAGVAKFEDGTTLFLVPPSDFLRKVLKVVGPERLYGVVLRLPPQPPAPSKVSSMHMQMHHPVNYYPERQPRLPPNQPEYNLASPKEDNQALSTPDYGRQKPPPYAPSSTEAPAVSQGYVPAAASQPSSVGLTPELIAALSKLVPAKTTAVAPTQGTPSSAAAEVSTRQQSFQQNFRPSMDGGGGAHNNYVPSSMEQNFRPPLPAPPNSQGWRQQVSESAGGNHISAQQQLMPSQIPPQQFQPYSSSSPAVHQMQDPNMLQQQQQQQQQGGVMTSSGLLSNLLQGGQFGAPPQQHQQHETQRGGGGGGYAVPHEASGGVYNNSPGFHHNITNQVQGGSYPHNQAGPIMGHFSSHHQNHQVQQQQMQAASASGQQSQSQPEEIDKNQRYQSTLQFAANLLLQIQQKQQQQQTNAQPGRGGPAN